MSVIFSGIFRFVLFVFLQVFVFNQVELGLGICLFICPLYILLLPFEINRFLLMIVAFGMGVIIDLFTNTYGLHASSLLLLSYLRKDIFNIFAPRDGYDPLKSPSYFDMGHLWFFSTFGTLLLIHTSWFFILEAFTFTNIMYTLQKIVLSCFCIYLISLLMQILIIRRGRK